MRCHLGAVPQERTAEEHTTGDHARLTRTLPRDFGRDGVSGLVTLDRAMRGRDVSRPDLDDERVAAEVIDELLPESMDGDRLGRRAPTNASRHCWSSAIEQRGQRPKVSPVRSSFQRTTRHQQGG